MRGRGAINPRRRPGSALTSQGASRAPSDPAARSKARAAPAAAKSIACPASSPADPKVASSQASRSRASCHFAPPNPGRNHAAARARSPPPAGPAPHWFEWTSAPYWNTHNLKALPPRRQWAPSGIAATIRSRRSPGKAWVSTTGRRPASRLNQINDRAKISVTIQTAKIVL